MRKATRSFIVAGLAATAMAALVLACTEMTPEPTPEPPAPTLPGTWESVFKSTDSDGDVRQVTDRLVFSASGKAFWHTTQFELSGDDRHHPHGDIADWRATGDTITKTFLHDHDDDGQWDSATIEKEYYLSASGNELFVHHWGSDETENSFDRYTRVQEPVPANPTLLGTWEGDTVRWGDDGPEGRGKITLTFTENRWIRVETQLDDAGETDYGSSSGAWTPVTESSVTKTFVGDRHSDDDGTWTIEERSFEKHYAWGAGGELFVIDWRGDWENANDAASPHIERYRRVENPLPSLEGVWIVRDEWEDDDGQVYRSRTRLTMGEEFEWLGEERVGGAIEVSLTISGSWRHDEKRQFIIVDVRDAVITAPHWSAEDVVLWTREHKGHQLRFAYASAGAPDRMMISSFHREQDYDVATNIWADSGGFPHGGYHYPFVKQP